MTDGSGLTTGSAAARSCAPDADRLGALSISVRLFVFGIKGYKKQAKSG